MKIFMKKFYEICQSIQAGKLEKHETEQILLQSFKTALGVLIQFISRREVGSLQTKTE